MPFSVGNYSKSNYSVAEKLLHQMVLGLPWVTKVSFDIDSLLSSRLGKPTNSNHIFICGLARAGTTILMRAFYQTGQFRSLTYRDMPFVLMPHAWHKLGHSSQKNRGVPQQRAHGDGITVGYDSPEALEEVFWRTFAGRDYIGKKSLVPHYVDDFLVKQFRNYVDRILQGTSALDQVRYLSKNNNNILRLSSIQRAFPNGLIIIPFRDPFQQSISLLEQHRRFCVIHQNDQFSYKYMQWLGHHEFGLTHRPFKFDKNISTTRDLTPIDGINYWLRLWNCTYSYLLKNVKGNVVFSCYEELCEDPNLYLNNIFRMANVISSSGLGMVERRMPKDTQQYAVDEGLWSESRMIYDELRGWGGNF